MFVFSAFSLQASLINWECWNIDNTSFKRNSCITFSNIECGYMQSDQEKINASSIMNRNTWKSGWKLWSENDYTFHNNFINMILIIHLSLIATSVRKLYHIRNGFQKNVLWREQKNPFCLRCYFKNDVLSHLISSVKKTPAKIGQAEQYDLCTVKNNGMSGVVSLLPVLRVDTSGLCSI